MTQQQIIIQLVAAIFTLFALSRVYLRFRENKLSSFAFIFWMAVWIVGIMVIMFPDFSSEIAKLVGIGRGSDVIIYASIAILFYLIFRLFIKIEDISKEITKLSREIALKGHSSKRSLHPKNR
jgi:small membrane protein